jgi:hypothetical protein
VSVPDALIVYSDIPPAVPVADFAACINDGPISCGESDLLIVDGFPHLKIQR